MHRLALLGLVACSFPQKHGASGDRGTTTADASNDAHETADARAMGDGSGALRCANDPFPTTAPATIQIGGTVYAQNLQAGTTPAGGVTVQLFDGGTSALFTTTSSTQGQFAGNVSTGARAVAGYLAAQGASGQGYLPTLYYPREPFAMDTTAIAILVITQSNLTTLYQLLGVPYAQADSTVFGTIVDCDGNPVAGATLAVMPPPGATAGRVYYMQNGVPSQTATSTDASGEVIVLDEPATTTAFSATSMGVTFHTYSIGLAANAVTMINVQPGAPSP